MPEDALNARRGYTAPRGARQDADIPISDHALLRWLERRLGYDIPFYRRAMWAEVGHIVEAGASAAVVDGLRYQVRDGIIVTVLPVHTLIDKERLRHLNKAKGR